MASVRDVFDEFLEYVKELSDIERAIGLLEWDQETIMPPGAAEGRAYQISTLTGIRHEKATAKKLGKYIERLSKEDAQKELSDEEKAIVREVKRSYEKATKLPEKLVKEIAKTKSESFEAWIRAKKSRNFDPFAPYLEKLVDLNRQVAEHYGYEDHPYSALLDDYEPYMTVSDLDPVLRKFEKKLVPIVHKIIDSGYTPDTSMLYRNYSPRKQEKFGRMVITDMGFDWNIGRLDVSEHPFTMGMGRDVRITTKYMKNYLPMSLFGMIHEAGHALYEQGFLPEWDRTPMAEAISMGYHESQSRLWENLVGRSRAFWEHYYPILQKTFPVQLSKVPLDDFYSAINNVKPSFIRVEADEVTYNLHILLRYDLELKLFNNELEAKDAPEVWNETMEKYLGITPPNPSLGILQDIHWSQGYFGYFPTYTLGNLYSAQIFATAKKKIRGLEGKIASGDLVSLKKWLNKNIHQYGKLYTAEEMTIRLSGEKLNPDHWIKYIKKKYGPIYGVKL